jgi:hypothetical protein
MSAIISASCLYNYNAGVIQEGVITKPAAGAELVVPCTAILATDSVLFTTRTKTGGAAGISTGGLLSSITPATSFGYTADDATFAGTIAYQVIRFTPAKVVNAP